MRKACESKSFPEKKKEKKSLKISKQIKEQQKRLEQNAIERSGIG